MKKYFKVNVILLFRVNIKMAEDSKENVNEDSATKENENIETVKNGGETASSVSDIPDHIKFKESLDFTITKVKIYLNFQWIKIWKLTYLETGYSFSIGNYVKNNYVFKLC